MSFNNPFLKLVPVTRFVTLPIRSIPFSFSSFFFVQKRVSEYDDRSYFIII